MTIQTVSQKFSALLNKARAYVAPAAASALVSVSSTALAAWPPTAADITTMFTDLGDNIGEIFMAVVAVGIILYGGVISVQAAFRFFSKFVRTSTGSNV